MAKLKQPGAIRIIREANQWYGLVHNTTSEELLKLSFGSQLSNSITTTSLITGVGGFNSGFDVVKDATDGWVCVISNATNDFSMIRLGNLISSPDPVTDVITSAVCNPTRITLRM